jgi:hypothetical protein
MVCNNQAVCHQELVCGMILVAILVNEDDLVMDMTDVLHICYNYYTTIVINSMGINTIDCIISIGVLSFFIVFPE